MIEEITKKIVAFIGQNNDFSKDQVEEMEYTLKVFSYEIIKVIFLILLFTYFGYGKETGLILLVMAFTKPFIGGYHESSQIRCFCATVVLALFIIILSIFNRLTLSSTLILSLINIFCIYHRAPVINGKMPIKKEKIIKRNRKIGMCNTIILIILAIMMLNFWWSSIIIWTITIQTMLMFNKKWIKKGVINYEN